MKSKSSLTAVSLTSDSQPPASSGAAATQVLQKSVRIVGLVSYTDHNQFSEDKGQPMSEWDAHVHCTCFLDGLTSAPPYPRSELTVNRFGVVTLLHSHDHSEDPEDLWCWRVGMTADGADAPQPCRHDNMKLVDEIFYWPGSVTHVGRYPAAESLIRDLGLSRLDAAIHRPANYDFASGGIWMYSTEAAECLDELHRLVKMPLEGIGNERTFIDALEILLPAAVETSNPIICHYNGVADDAW
ncbi:hypothetical protein [Jongsikchunia kroppenstedtii]|uniref:hypothetical protein n=1 Tax=Jongsikchunia kroppenstedtii TaxID=1121721 RepID=UPI000373F658|nr:hypothetical protein [Jongsikchunia kroppenstedtii]